MIRVLLLFLIREKRGVFINKLTLPTRICASLLNIFFYWFTAKAFVPSEVYFANSNPMTLFYYIMIGELALFFAFDTILIFSHQTKQLINEGVLESLLLTKTSLSNILLKLSVSSLMIGSLTFFIELTVLILFFDFHYPLAYFFQAGLIQIIFLPFYIGMGLCAAGLLIYFKRGMNALGTGLGVLSILSGTYFPTNVFPSFIQTGTQFLNPMHFMLIQIRHVFEHGAPLDSWIYICLYSFLGSLLFILIGLFLIKHALLNMRRKGGLILLGT